MLNASCSIQVYTNDYWPAGHKYETFPQRRYVRVLFVVRKRAEFLNSFVKLVSFSVRRSAKNVKRSIVSGNPPTTSRIASWRQKDTRTLFVAPNERPNPDGCFHY